MGKLQALNGILHVAYVKEYDEFVAKIEGLYPMKWGMILQWKEK